MRPWELRHDSAYSHDVCISVLQSVPLMLRIAELVGCWGHHCGYCIAPLRCSMRLDHQVVTALMHRAWPFCCPTSHLRTCARRTTSNTVNIDLLWQATGEVICTVPVPFRTLQDQNGIESLGLQHVLWPLWNLLRFPQHFASLIRPYVHQSLPAAFSSEVRGRVHLSIRARRNWPFVTVQLAPPGDGLLRMLRVHMEQRRYSIIGAFCVACFHPVNQDDTATRCRTCNTNTLCSSCLLPSHLPPRCIFCVDWVTGDDRINLLCIKHFWFDLGGAFAREAFLYPPTLPTISGSVYEI